MTPHITVDDWWAEPGFLVTYAVLFLDLPGNTVFEGHVSMRHLWNEIDQCESPATTDDTGTTIGTTSRHHDLGALMGRHPEVISAH